MKETSVCDGIEHVRSDSDFTHIHNEIVRDKRIDFATKGVFLTLWSLPDTWEFNIEGLRKCFGGSPGLWVRTMKLLTECEYMKRVVVKHEGKNGAALKDHYKYIFFDKPSKNDKSTRDYDFRNYASRNYENVRQLNTNSINNESKNSGGSSRARENDTRCSSVKQQPNTSPAAQKQRAAVSAHTQATPVAAAAPKPPTRPLPVPKQIPQPNSEVFFSWQKRIAEKYGIQEQVIHACTSAFARAVGRGWKSSTGKPIANWQEYFGSLMLAKNTKLLRNL